ncbi:MAG: RNA 2'-phosphotransferase [Bacteroidota bacterium]
MNDKQIKRTSKFLSLILRHRPEVIGIELDENGWANIDELIQKMNAKDANVNLDILHTVVATNNKKRFTFNDDQTKIRASQGHSIGVDLDLTPQTPPTILYHGTAQQFVDNIQQQGLKKMNRQHVHLSADLATASQVGQRHGKLFIFEVAAAQMEQDGFTFYLSENGVWLTEAVPARYLSVFK